MTSATSASVRPYPVRFAVNVLLAKKIASPNPSGVVVSKKTRCFAGHLLEPVVLRVAGGLPGRGGLGRQLRSKC